MPMKNYPLVAPLAFLIDAEVTAYLVLKQDQGGNDVPDEVQELLDAGKFGEAAKNKDEVLADNCYFEVVGAREVLSSFDVEHICHSSFDGAVCHLDRKLNETGVTESYSDDYIVFIEPKHPASLFHAPYENIDEVLSEFKESLCPLGDFPPDFDWAGKLVSISGIYFA